MRLMAKVARMYHERGIRQPQIAADLRISQSRVSRLLKQAAEQGIVRTTVSLPSGVFTELEEQLEERFALLDSVVVDAEGSSGDVAPALGSAAAAYIIDTLSVGDIVGISSWSATLLATVNAMRPRNGLDVAVVTQLVGGLGDPSVQVSATRLLDRLSRLTGARPVFLPTPGLVNDATVRRALLDDPSVAEAIKTWDQLTVVLLGIGSVQPSPLLQSSGNAIDSDQQERLGALGAVGDVCFRFFDQAGVLVPSPFNERVVGITPDQLSRVPRRVGVAGGPAKTAAIRAAVSGGWVNTLITDTETATALLT